MRIYINFYLIIKNIVKRLCHIVTIINTSRTCNFNLCLSEPSMTNYNFFYSKLKIIIRKSSDDSLVFQKEYIILEKLF